METATVNLKGCPFDGSEPRTYFRSKGTICGKYALTLHMECPECGITMSKDITQDILGYILLGDLLGDIYSLIAQWNERHQ